MSTRLFPHNQDRQVDPRLPVFFLCLSCLLRYINYSMSTVAPLSFLLSCRSRDFGVFPSISGIPSSFRPSPFPYQCTSKQLKLICEFSPPHSLRPQFTAPRYLFFCASSSPSFPPPGVRPVYCPLSFVLVLFSLSAQIICWDQRKMFFVLASLSLLSKLKYCLLRPPFFHFVCAFIRVSRRCFFPSGLPLL